MNDEHVRTQLRRDYIQVARSIALKNSLFLNGEKPTPQESSWYYFLLFIVVVILAGLLTGFGAAAPIINGILSFTKVVNIRIGYIALCAFSLYAIPWALVYIPEVSNLFRNWWENRQDRKNGINIDETSVNSAALQQAHNILAMYYRKALNEKNHVSSITNALESTGLTMMHLAILDALEAELKKSFKDANSATQNIITTTAQSDAFKLGWLLYKQRLLESNPLDNLLQRTAESHLNQEIQLDSIAFLKAFLDQDNSLSVHIHSTIRENVNKHRLNINLTSLNTLRLKMLERAHTPHRQTNHKQIEQRIWRIQRDHTPTLSWWSWLAEKLGTTLGFLNAAIANTTGTALAPLYFISTLFMIYAMPNAIIPFYLALTLVSAFALSGFVASFGITRKSIERAFSNMANFVLDQTRLNREHKRFKYDGSIYYMPFAYLAYLNKRYSLLPISMALFLSVAIASFNFLAAVTFAHILLYPSMLMHPTQVAKFSIQSLASLHPLEIGLGAIGFGFTVIAVAPLMLCAWKQFMKTIRLEPLNIRSWITFSAFLTSLANTLLLFRMMLRTGSPLDLFFGGSPVLVQMMTYLAPVCIFILGFALFYMGIQEMLNQKGRNMEQIYNETLALKANYSPKPIEPVPLNEPSSSNDIDLVVGGTLEASL